MRIALEKLELFLSRILANFGFVAIDKVRDILFSSLQFVKIDLPGLGEGLRELIT